jgi:ketosteroid isomerase-like protein
MSGKIPPTDWSVAPPVLSASMAAFARADLDALMSGFAQDAVVIDEGRELTGHTDVRAWLGRALGAYERTIEVRGSAPWGSAMASTAAMCSLTSRARSPAAQWI